MSYLPILRRAHKGALVLDGAAAAHEQIRNLADLYREDPEGVGDMLIQIADLKDQAERERDLDGLGHAEHVRDSIVGELLDEIGGAQIHLDPRDNHHALMQARSLAHQAHRIADVAGQRASELAVLTAVARSARERRRRPPIC
ncbi:hypothetical protein [Streptomyces triticiradicis]|uniref:Uncharacterized protein n=1 Tax=Streptomyces triticiradicis TaxID=2651189 RepID=A0A7J5DM92_9ACTN|nr:hypothetical protein [Streptomyces triticiradicis]KAB1989819.1 hypothetical protein F8144_05595 [Streptomyces triticiradicis]